MKLIPALLIVGMLAASGRAEKVPYSPELAKKAESSSAAEILQALSTIEIPEVVFKEKPVRVAVQELQRLSEQNDPKKEGIKFVLRLPPAAEGVDPEAATISFALRKVKLQAALDYLCKGIRGGKQLRYEVKNGAVFILPVTEGVQR